MPASLKMKFVETAPGWMKFAARLVFGGIFVIAAFLSIQDYQTSVLGYLLLPSQKIDPETTATLVGALPQLFQIALAWVIASREKGRRLAMLLWLIAFLFDFTSDYYFKSAGVAWPSDVIPHALVAAAIVGETFFLYTFGSEFMLLFSWSNVAPLVTPGLAAWWGGLRARVAAAMAEAGQETGGMFNMAEEAATRGNKSNGAKYQEDEYPDEEREYSGRGLFDE